MKLRELFGYTSELQNIALMVGDWRITALADALECCMNDAVMEGAVTKISTIDNALVVWVSCAEKEHDGCNGCRYEDKDYDQEPCKRCRCMRSTSGRDLYVPKEGKQWLNLSKLCGRRGEYATRTEIADCARCILCITAGDARLII